MSILGDALHALATRSDVKATIGARFDLASGTRYLYRGDGGTFTDSASHVWEAVGSVGSISGMFAGVGDKTEPMVFSLSALPSSEFASIYVDQKTEIHGRECAAYLIMFNDDWSLASDPIILRTTIMERLVKRVDANGRVTSFNLETESFQSSRFRSPNVFLTHRDQTARHPGDDILERISGYASNMRVLYWS